MCRRPLSVLQPRMVHDVAGGKSVLWLRHDHALDDVFRLVRHDAPLLLWLKLPLPALHFCQNGHVSVAIKWGRAAQDDVEDDTEGPNVNLLGVVEHFLGKDLAGHVARCADLCFHRGLVGAELLRRAEVAHLHDRMAHRLLALYQVAVQLRVPVADAPAVEVVDWSCHLPHEALDRRRVAFGEQRLHHLVLGEGVEEAAAGAELQDHEDLHLSLEGLVQPDDVGVLDLPHDVDLLPEPHLVRLQHVLDGAALVRLLVPALPARARVALAEVLRDLIGLRRVSLRVLEHPHFGLDLDRGRRLSFLLGLLLVLLGLLRRVGLRCGLGALLRLLLGGELGLLLGDQEDLLHVFQAVAQHRPDEAAHPVLHGLGERQAGLDHPLVDGRPVVLDVHVGLPLDEDGDQLVVVQRDGVDERARHQRRAVV
mmetsp:Transcript_75725/g.214042  ORF Transcript_75725/g.214042 Transcript_75725/m.214042 type:complete len:423 (-) Transcript_75725:1069-2337(-)